VRVLQVAPGDFWYDYYYPYQPKHYTG
jgi:hypothetical protein